MKPRDYCCCAIPIINAGIYATLAEQFVLGLLVGILSVGTPSIVGAATPSFAKWILGIIGFVGAGIQVLGIIGVAKEKPTLFRRYLTLHSLILSAGFAVAIAWTVISVTRHSTAQDKCIQDFFVDSDSSVADAAETICNIFPYVDVGIMGGLILVLVIAQVYFYLVLSSYSSTQTRDHIKYDSVSLKPADAIAMTDRNDPWDTRASHDEDHTRPGHYRDHSAASASDILSEPQAVASDSLSDRNYGYRQGSYPYENQYQNYPTRQNSQPATLVHPQDAYTHEPTPTPSYPQYGNYSSGTTYGSPPNAQAHPATTTTATSSVAPNTQTRMPAPTQSYPVSFDVTNDMLDCASLQLLRDYGSGTGAIVVLKPGESISLILDSGSPYRYAVKTRSRVVNLIARSWRDIHCEISNLFDPVPSTSITSTPSHQTESHLLSTGFSVEKRWRDHRHCLSSWED